MSATNNVRTNRFCFTYFPFSTEEATKEDEHRQLSKEERQNVLQTWSIRLIKDAMGDRLLYTIIGEEYAPSTGRLHYQGYLRLNERVRLSTVKRIIGLNSIHLEPCRGTENDNIKYVKKNNDANFPEKVIYEYFRPGNDPNNIMNFELNDRASLRREEKMINFLAVLRTKNLDYIEANFPIQFYREQNLIQKYRQYKLQGSEFWNGELPDKNFWIWGGPGVGKSYWARSQLGTIDTNGHRKNTEVYNKGQNKWWDGYNNQKVVIVEDWNPGENGSYSKALLHYLKIWTDKYSFNGEVKNGTIYIHPGRYFLIITSNHNIDDAFFNCNPIDVSAIKRRFREVEIKGRDDIFLQTRLDPKILDDELYQDD